jgi:hypothetical protein
MEGALKNINGGAPAFLDIFPCDLLYSTWIKLYDSMADGQTVENCDAMEYTFLL